ncbi:hypothetical protein NEOC65_000398 [Neochlamydia sp. AcF65]|nr:hypothetical protein [Neochlamydia sp. AcF65]
MIISKKNGTSVIKIRSSSLFLQIARLGGQPFLTGRS